MSGWTVDIIAPNGGWWGSAFGETAKEARHNADGLLMKLEAMEELNEKYAQLENTQKEDKIKDEKG